ncbi:uncharacterized protein LOC135479799 [Liolophura sinensis]|uniref:uncharacterized protein LOC135479799 n=1 Tax=Liolophura sinensis TaxID=3198878 RepID=UPI003158065B
MTEKGNERTLEWSSMDDPYSIQRIQDEVGLPILVHVLEGIYSVTESGTFSGGDYLKLHGCETLEKVVAYPTQEENGKFTKYYSRWNTPLEIPLDYRVKARVIPKHGENRVYPAVELLVEDFPRYVQVGVTIAGKEKSGASVPIVCGSVLELLKTTATGKQRSLLCLLDTKEVYLPMDCLGRFTIVPDSELYTIREIVSRFPLPQLIALDDNGSETKKYLSEQANKALSNLENFKGTFVLDSTVSEQVVYGTHRLEFHHMNVAHLNLSLQAIVVIPFDSEATFQIALNRESSIYTTVFAQNYMKTLKTKSLVPMCIGQQGSKERTIQLPEGYDEIVTDNNQGTIDQSPSGRVKSKVPGPKTLPKPAKPIPAKRKVLKPPCEKLGTSTKMSDDSESDTDYEPVTPEKIAVFAAQTETTKDDDDIVTTKGETLDRPRRPSRYEVVELPPTLPDPGRPERPERPDRAGVVPLPSRAPKLNKGKMITKTLSRAKDVIKDVPVTVKTLAKKAFPGTKKSATSSSNSLTYGPNASTSVPNSPASGPNSPVSGPNSPTGGPNSPASGSNSKLLPVLLKVVSEDEESEASDSDDVYDYPDPNKEDLRFPPLKDALPFDDAVSVTKKQDEEQSFNNKPRQPTYRNLTEYPINPRKGNSLDRRKQPENTQDGVSTTCTLPSPSKPIQSASKVEHQALKPVQSVKPQPNTLATVVKSEPTTVSNTPPSKKPVAPVTAPKPVRPNLKAIGPKFSYSREEIMEMSVIEIFETMKKIGLGEKADKFKENCVDGSFLVLEMTDTALAEFDLTEVESLQVKRFMKDGKLPKMS